MRGRVRYRITRGGLLFLLAVFLVAGGALVSANNLLFLILATMLSTLLVSGFVSRLCLAGLELEFHTPEHVSARRPVRARLTIRNVKSWMPSFSIRVSGMMTSPVYFPMIPGGSQLDQPVEVRFARRGAHRDNSFSLSTHFPFGFFEKIARVTLRREIIVYPSLDPHPRMENLFGDIQDELESHFKGRGSDFYRIRPYQTFESARHIDWKTTARTRDLQVREFTREEERAVEIYLDRFVPSGGDEWFEHAVDSCAYLVSQLASKGAPVRFAAQEFEARIPEQGDVYTILKYLALVVPLRGPSKRPSDANGFHILVTAVPESYSAMGLDSTRVLGPADLAPAAGPAADGA